MPPTIRNELQRQIQTAFATPQRMIRAVATGQQGGFSGTIPGTDSDPTQLGMQWSTIQPPDTGDQVAAVGHAVLANDGSPVVVMGNMNVSGDSGYPPEGFQDGGFAFTDAEGNAVAGFSHPTGLWGFGGYASLTGEGKTETPGDLTQAGGLTVNDVNGDGITLNSAGDNGQIEITSSTTAYGLNGTIAINDAEMDIQCPNTMTLGDPAAQGAIAVSTGDFTVASNGGQLGLDSGGGEIDITSDGGGIMLDSSSGGLALQSEANVTVDAGALVIFGLPDADPHNDGQIWNNGGILTVSAG